MWSSDTLVFVVPTGKQWKIHFFILSPLASSVIFFFFYADEGGKKNNYRCTDILLRRQVRPVSLCLAFRDFFVVVVDMLDAVIKQEETLFFAHLNDNNKRTLITRPALICSVSALC